MIFVDSHCHLTFPPLCDGLDGVLDRARAGGVTRIVVPAYDPPSWRQIDSLVAAHAGMVFPAYGLHPWVADQPLDLDLLADYLQRDSTVALGEIGLDGKIEAPSIEAQIPVLEKQLALAQDIGLPVILHCRGAFAELEDILARFTPRLRGVFHAFTRSPELARRFLGLGLHLGIGGAVTRPRARNIRETVAAVPLEFLLLETDAPSIGLDGVDPIAAEPRHVVDIACAVAELRGTGVDHVAACTTASAANLFGLDPVGG